MTLTILHKEAGVCYGNITAENILLLKNGERDQALLSSFTEARFQVDAEKSTSWELWKMKDRERLSRIFGRAKSHSVCVPTPSLIDHLQLVAKRSST